jgi:hypothetical protein
VRLDLNKSLSRLSTSEGEAARTAEAKSKLANPKVRNLIIGDPEDLVHLDWSEEWRPETKDPFRTT